MPARVHLSAKRFVYEALVERFGRRRNPCPAQVIDEAENLALFAYRNHPGAFADGRVENALVNLADAVANADRPCCEWDCFSGKDRPRILHVASEVYQVGGHSRFLAKWIDRDLASNHCVVLTRQTREIPPLLASSCSLRGAKVVSLPTRFSKLERAAVLENLSKQADRVILHHHPHDAIPVLAFSGDGGPPVAYFNHAHFWFSLGGTVADMTLNTLPYFLRLTEKYRFPRRVALLPCVSGNKQITAFNKDQAKRDLRLDPAIPVLITIGAEEYYRPGSGYDFFATLQKVLAACGPLQVLVVGPRPEADFVPPALARNARVRLLGPVADPVPFYQAADLCLESFPQPSLGGFVEAVTYGGAFPIPAYAPAESILQIDQPPLPSVSPRTGNEGQYVASIAGRLADLSQTRALARELQTRLLALDREWPALLQGVYSQLDGLCHAPGPIPEGHCSFEQEHRLMAALRPFRLAEEIHARFPYFQGCKLNLQSALQGAGPLGDALRCEWRHLRQGCRRRLGSR